MRDKDNPQDLVGDQWGFTKLNEWRVQKNNYTLRKRKNLHLKKSYHVAQKKKKMKSFLHTT
jgi:hypothetical protein